MFIRGVINGGSQSITATSRFVPCEDNVRSGHLDSQLSDHSHCAHSPRHPVPALALTSVVRRIATAVCYGRQSRPKATSLHGDSCTGFSLPSLFFPSFFFFFFNQLFFPSKLWPLFSYRRQNSIDWGNLLGAHPIKTSSYQGRFKALLDWIAGLGLTLYS